MKICLCHYYVCDNLFVTCRFVTMYSDRAQTALPYAMNSEFSKVLAGQMVSGKNLLCEILITK